MQENEQVIPVNKPPKWLYGIIYGLGFAILAMIVAIGYGLIVGFEKKDPTTGETLVSIPAGKKFADFNVKLSATQTIEQVEYGDYRIFVYVKDSENKQNLIVILSATGGNEVGRFILGN